MTTTWRAELQTALEAAQDSGPVERMSPCEAAFDVMFDPGWGGAEGPPVLAWTPTRVYFPVQYDGSEWLGSAPRNPTTEGQTHEGGG